VRLRLYLASVRTRSPKPTSPPDQARRGQPDKDRQGHCPQGQQRRPPGPVLRTEVFARDRVPDHLGRRVRGRGVGVVGKVLQRSFEPAPDRAVSTVPSVQRLETYVLVVGPPAQSRVDVLP
jgi:hypothetical protein